MNNMCNYILDLQYMIPPFILPANVKLKAVNMIFIEGHLYLNVTACQTGSKCPLCKKTSYRVHSKYTRMLADLPFPDTNPEWI